MLIHVKNKILKYALQTLKYAFKYVIKKNMLKYLNIRLKILIFYYSNINFY